MNSYNTLANGIIQQAAADHQRAVKFLSKHPHTEELEMTVARLIKERKARIRARRGNDLPPAQEKKSAEELLFNRILRCEALVEDTEDLK